MAGLRTLIDGPEFVSFPDPLWEAAQHPNAAGPHWQQGVTWQEWCGGGRSTYDACLALTGDGAVPPSPGALGPDGSDDGCSVRGASAFTVYAAYDSSVIGQPDTDQAEQALARSEAYQSSRIFWSGQAGGQPVVWPHLAAGTSLADPQGVTLQTAADTVTGAATDIAAAVGALDAELAARYGGEGAVHVPPSVLAVMMSRILVRHDDAGRPRTPGGNIIVAAPGYDGSGPTGAAPDAGTSWIYATGALFGYRSDVNVREFPGTFDRATNTVHKIASRTYLYGFACVHLAAEVTVPS